MAESYSVRFKVEVFLKQPGEWSRMAARRMESTHEWEAWELCDPDVSCALRRRGRNKPGDQQVDVGGQFYPIRRWEPLWVDAGP